MRCIYLIFFLSAAQVKSKPKKPLDLFEEDDEDGDIFSEKAAQNKEAEEPVIPSEKKMPAGAISMFGPATKSLLSEGLKKRQTSPDDDSEKSEKNGLAPDVGTAVTQTPKPLASSLFSDDEDTQMFPTIPRSQSDPHTMSQSRILKPHVTLFDDDEEEDLFASASKPKPNPAKTFTPQPSKAISSSLFGDDEDQWINPKTSAAKQETKTGGGMKASASAPSSLPGVTTSQKSTLFDDDDDDLFAPAKQSSQKKPQKVSLLFEDEHEEEKGSLFGIKTDDGANATAKPTSLLDKLTDSSDAKKGAKEKPSLPQKPAAKPPEGLPSSAESKKKPVGAVSLFGGINVLAKKQAKSVSDEHDNGDDHSPPPNVKTQEKVKTNALSLFDDDEVEDEHDPIFTPSKPTARNTAKPTEERPQAKSTGVFLDEELLFSPTQQKDNDPDVDIFAVSVKTTSTKLSSAKPMTSLFSEDEEDDLFGSSKPRSLPPKVAEKPSTSNDRALLVKPETVSDIQKPAPSPVEPKEPSSRIGKLQASLKINPAVFLPGSAPSMPGAVSVLPGLDPSSSSGVSSSSMSPSPATTPIGARTDSEAGVSFDAPLQVQTLQSANKSRVKGSIHRRPQSRAARQASQRTAEEQDDIPAGSLPVASSSSSTAVLPPSGHLSQIPTSQNSAPITSSPLPSRPHPAQIPTKPSLPTLPVANHAKKLDSSKDGNQGKVLPPLEEDDIFASDGFFTSAAKPPTKKAEHPVAAVPKTDVSNLPSIFDDNSDDLFQTVKPKMAAKTSKSSPFMEDDDDDDDFFGVKSSSTATSTSGQDVKSSDSFPKQDIFEDDVAVLPKAHKEGTEKPTDVNLFDDIDIFADLADSFAPKQKAKAKEASRSIFDDDMDDIFAPSTVKTATKATPKAKTSPPSQGTSTTVDSTNMFDDPLNALGRN
uniref:WASH complex subunit FAM21-like n=1 Tax=Hippocampus comes TaxID=109280 RepID=A0A3Q2XF65_HIPCM